MTTTAWVMFEIVVVALLVLISYLLAGLKKYR